jgi:hypothetical protein
MKNIFLTTYTPAREHPLKHACLRKSLLYLGDETRVFQGGLSPYKMLVFTSCLFGMILVFLGVIGKIVR